MRHLVQALLVGIRDRLGLRAPRVMVESVNELPDIIKPLLLYAVGDGKPWLAAIDCPCGCGSVIQLSLLEDDAPHWSLSIERDGTGTIMPSVWRTKGCRSHFFLRHGTIKWCYRSPASMRRRFFGFLCSRGA